MRRAPVMRRCGPGRSGTDYTIAHTIATEPVHSRGRRPSAHPGRAGRAARLGRHGSDPAGGRVCGQLPALHWTPWGRKDGTTQRGPQPVRRPRMAGHLRADPSLAPGRPGLRRGRPSGGPPAPDGCCTYHRRCCLGRGGGLRPYSLVADGCRKHPPADQPRNVRNLIEVIEGTRSAVDIHARINERAKVPARKRASADKGYYVKSRVMSPQVGTPAGRTHADVTPTSYPPMAVSNRDGDIVGRSQRGTLSDSQRDGVHVADSAVDVSVALDRFYSCLLYELGEFARRPSATAIGAAVVVKRVAKEHGIAVAERLPLPRFNRAELQDRADTRWLAEQ